MQVAENLTKAVLLLGAINVCGILLYLKREAFLTISILPLHPKHCNVSEIAEEQLEENRKRIESLGLGKLSSFSIQKLEDTIEVALVVITRQTAFAKRQALRKVWNGKHSASSRNLTLKYKLLFLFGISEFTTDPKLSSEELSKIKEENEVNSDLLIPSIRT